MNVGLEKVILLEPDEILYARLLGVLFGVLNPLRVDVDTYAASTVVLCGGNDNPPIATA